MACLPNAEMERIEAAIGAAILRIELHGMRGEEYETLPPSGYFCVTWGIVLEYNGGCLNLAWGGDVSRPIFGDPYRIAAHDPDALLRFDSLARDGVSYVRQDVSQLTPWSEYVGHSISGYELLAYESDYPCASDDPWHPVAWGLLLRIGTKPLLVAAARHEDPFGSPTCMDEIVVAFSTTAIERLQRARFGFRNEGRSCRRGPDGNWYLA